ncbi:hypothetical protein DM01DRAFT_1297191 [Hesseltinella vesiculosa]|uniref:Trafficking protein particle complex II-specific subunit 65 IgD3 domain-containing protein n=1 Tax=Hesseltinella vesiculosa TaxID=101127 RepID=A0A1X2GY14_9FUNG|nr:hypothetical protein DM01DRAFT_1297191 [Hesseltinella vesiculosa]
MASNSNISTELFFNELSFKVIIPNLDYSKDNQVTFDKIINSPELRSFAFYDEQLRVYLYVRLPCHIAGSGPDVTEAVHHFFQQLDVHLEASIQDMSTHHSSLSNASAASTALSAASSAPTSPQLTKRDVGRPNTELPPFYSHTYNGRGQDPDPLFFEHDQAHCCLFPIDIPIVYMKSRGNAPGLAIHCSIAYRPLPAKDTSYKEQAELDQAEYDVSLFDTVDLLQGLGEDPIFSVSGNNPPSQHFIMENRGRQPNGNDAAPTPLTASTSTPSQFMTLRTQVFESIPLRSGVTVKMRTTNANVTDKTVMMSVELENPIEAGCEFLATHMDVQVSNAVVTPAFTKDMAQPELLNRSDQMVFVYNVTLLEDGSTKPPTAAKRIFTPRRPTVSTAPIPPPQDERIQPQRVVIQIYGSPIIHGCQAQALRSKWNTMLDVSCLRQRREDAADPRFQALLTSLTRTQTSVANSTAGSPSRSLASPASYHSDYKRISRPNSDFSGPVSKGGSSMRRAPEMEVADGIVISFTAPDTVMVGKIFSLQLFIVNRSKHTRRFQVMIPNRRPQPPSDVLLGKSNMPILPQQSPVDPFMEESEFLRQYFENETHEADIISLENNINLCPLGPSTSQTVDIRFIAVKEKLHTVDLVQLVDQDTGFVTNLRHVLEVFVEH